MKYDTIIIGHITIDVNVFPWGLIENVLGGAPTYTGFALTTLKKKAGVVSKLGQDFPEKFSPVFSKFGLDTEGILATSGQTTTFENTYDEKGGREQVCKVVSDSISPEDVPKSYQDTHSYYISPVAGEISPDVIESVKNSDNIVMFDPQGIFRDIGEGGKVNVKMPDNLEDYLKNVDIIKLGKGELKAFKENEEEVLKTLTEMGPKTAILTLGEEGCMILAGDKLEKIKGLDVEVKDLTGAGDVFGAAFLSNYLDTEDPFKSARIGVIAAGLKLQYKGPTGFPTMEEVEKEL
ncbi:hypothetical protein AKJ48_03650 [candidate division MSBL1 archaeon SCGC-AAA261O19]|uniref:Carbohydrate kinase PfkB domain-containing protein n=1 Tax=candidate division MSBL1 archaeon SCGC-AAA261O19 TaxID=1698277 RepID=A0A133VBI7_9EURY|nr:hypothetical protein AKJ48_03650 [candidate division MSBL1 archaeon SCGC-AAA261O19]